MSKLLHINEYIVNPDSIAYLKHSVAGDGTSLGTYIYFNAYAAVCSVTGDTAWKMPFIEIRGMQPVQIMDFINNEPSF